MFRKPPSGLLAILVLSGFVIHWLADAIAATMVGDFVTRHLAIMFGVDATKMLATASEIMLPVIIAAILTYGAFLIGVKEKAANPSKLRIDFSEHISGCKSLNLFPRWRESYLLPSLGSPSDRTNEILLHRNAGGHNGPESTERRYILFGMAGPALAANLGYPHSAARFINGITR